MAEEDPGDDAVFQLLPRLLQVLPSASTRTAAPSPLSALYPALLSAARADPALTPLVALSPLLAHVATAAVVDRSAAAADAAAALATALALRAPPSVAAFMADLCVLLAATRAGARGRVSMFPKFAEASSATEGAVADGSTGASGGGENGNGAWPATTLHVDCDEGTAAAVVDLIVRLVRSPAWVRVGSRVRGFVVCDVLSARGVAAGGSERTDAEDEDARVFARLLLSLRDAATSGVALPRPLALRVDYVLAELRREAVEAARPAASRRSSIVTPPTKKRRRVPDTPGTGTGSRIEDRLQAVSGMAWGPAACALVARLCVSVLRDRDGINGGLDVSAMALEVGVNLLNAAVGEEGKDAVEFSKGANATAALASYLDLAASLLEVAAIAQGRHARHCELESSRSAVPTGGASATAQMSSGFVPSRDGSGRDSLRANQTDASVRIAHPQDANALASAVTPTLLLLQAIPHFAAAHSSAAGSLRAMVITRASMILWRLSDIYVAFVQVDSVRSDRMLNGENQDEFSTFLAALRTNLVTVAAAMGEIGLDAARVTCPSARSALLRSFARTLACEARPSATADAELSTTRLEAVIRECLTADCPVLTAGALAALADLVCACSLCRHGCVVDRNSHNSSAGLTTSPCSRPVWTTCYRLVEPLVRGAGHDLVVGAATRVLCRLVTHAPTGKVGGAGAELVQAVWHPLSRRARREASSSLPLIFAASARDDFDATSEADDHADSRDIRRLHATEDSWDGPERAFRVDGTGGGFGVVAKLLGTELQEQLCNTRSQQIDPIPLGLLARICDRGGGAESKVVAMAWEALLRVAVRDQMNARLESTKEEQSAHSASATPAFRAWNELAFASYSVDGLVTRDFATSDEGLVLLGYRSFSSNSRTSIGGLQQAWDHSVADVIARSLVSRYKSWLPISLGSLLSDDAFASRLVTVVGERSVVGFWDKVPRFALGAVLRDGNAVTLESLALRVKRPAKDLVNRVCADALTRTALQSANAFDGSADDKSIQLIELVMGMTIADVIESRVGKIVQRIVMELGAGRDVIVKRALCQVSEARRTRRASQTVLTADELVVEHFLLVMDAVNRGLFAARIPMSERLRCLSILDSVLRLCHKSLNLFIPKVMATLKMCLRIEGADRSFRDAVCRVWVTFMSSLGPSRLGPHLGQVISILAPLLGQHHRSFAPAICDIFTKNIHTVAPYFPDISLLVSTIAHPSFAPVANIVLDGEKSLLHETDGIVSSDMEEITTFVNNLNEVLTQATTHDSAAIRCLALDHILLLLRSRRGWLSTCLSASGDNWESLKKDVLRHLVHGFTGLLLHSDCSVRDRAIRCLGEVGAIDPVRLGDGALSGQKPRDGSSSLSSKRQHLPSTVRTLSIDLLKDYLVSALHRGDLPGAGNRLNRLGLAVQELLRVCGCGPETPPTANELADTITKHIALFGDAWEEDRDLDIENHVAAHFWGRLPDDVKEAVHPYLSRPFDTSAYNVRAAGSGVEGEEEVPFARLAEHTLQTRGRIWARLSAAASGDVGSVQASEWRMQMTAQLTDYVGDRGRFGCLFKALRPVLRYEDAVSTYLLPLVIVDALECSIEKAEPVSSPVVLSFILGEFKDAMDAGGEAAQSVFLLLDTLRDWRDVRGGRVGRDRYREERERHSTGGNGVPRRRLQITENELIEKAVSSDVLSRLVDLEGRSDLSLMLLAKAAHRCRAYSRAILYAEQYVLNIRRSAGIEAWPAFVKEMLGGARHTRHQGGEENLSIEENEAGEHTFSSEVRISETAKKVASLRDGFAESDALTLMQLCYVELEDADSMAGVAALRVDTGLSETILDAEASGNFDDALLCYERALAATPGDEAMHAGFLRCLRTLGHWETMLAHAEGLGHKKYSIQDSPATAESLKESAMALGMEAAWRLGRWDRVDELCRDSSAGFNISGSSTTLSKPAKPAVLLNLSGGAGPLPAQAVTDNGRWESLYGTAVGEMLSCVRRRDVTAIQTIASRARSYLLSPAANAAMEGFARAYPLIVKLHSLADIEDAMLFFCEGDQPLPESMGKGAQAGVEGHRKASLTKRLVGIHSRSDATASSLRVREPILSCRRVCLELMGRHSEAAEVSLQLASLARESGNLRAAASAAFRAVSSAAKNSDEWFAASAETARIMAAKGDKTGALLSLEKDIDRMTSLLRSCDISDGASKALEMAARRRLASAHVLAGKWIEEARSAPVKEIVKHYQTATELAPTLGDPFYALGRFYDSMLRNQSEGTGNRAKYVPTVLSSFTEALRLGHGWVFEILPRMLTVCFDFFSKVEVDLRNDRNVDHEVVRKAQRATQRAFHTLPKYMWMTVVPQLMSRVLHPSDFVREQLRELLASIVMEFPDQAIWMIAPSSQLAAKERKQVASDILNKAVQLARRVSGGKTTPAQAKSRAATLKSTARNGLCVIKQLIQVCSLVLPKDRRGRADDCSQEFGPLRKDLQVSRVIVPTLAALTVAIPIVNAPQRHDPFAPQPVTIADMETTVLVMSSLMRPRRIGFVGSDGKSYRFLAKREAAGDMRKDSRLIDFLTVVNRLLSKDREAQQRELHLKTYAVLPLTEETGLIEWVNDIVPLRTLIRGEQQRIGQLPDSGTVQAKHSSMSKQRFHDEWGIPSHPAVLDKFFLRQFGSDPQEWLAARNLWTRSVAAWSMTGYVVGLGDRHGENLLIETTTGRCVHVDFAMLFDKGMTLKVPEIVPFRLTHNMVGAMGISGYEGSFRQVSEIVLGVLRGNADSLMGVLEAFLHDPLADWARGKSRAPAVGRSSGQTGGGGDEVIGDEGGNFFAAEMRRAVELKLRGVYGRGEGELPLSIKGQVQRLIHEATSTGNLSQMYIWWGAWGM